MVDLVQEHGAYVQDRTTSQSTGLDLTKEHQETFPGSYAAKPPPAWYDQPVDKTGTMPMVDEYGRVIPGSEGMSTASMSPRQLALLGLTAASIPLSLGAGAGAGALFAGSRALPYAVPAARMLTNALVGGTSGKVAGEDTGGVTASAILNALLPEAGTVLGPLANNRLLANLSPLNLALRGISYGARRVGAPHVSQVIDTVSHYLPSLPVAGNVVAKTGRVIANPLAPAYVPGVNDWIGTYP